MDSTVKVFNLTDCNLTKSPHLIRFLWCHMFCVITALIELELPFLNVANCSYW